MTTSRRWLVALACCTGLVVVCVAYVDRPVADWANAHLRATLWFTLAVDLLRPLRLVLAAALLFLAGSGLWILRHRTLAAWTRVPLQCAWAMMWALLAAHALKLVVGRTQVDPPYLVNHVHEFRPLHGGQNYDAFPSATMAVACAMLTVLWHQVRVLRAVCVLVGMLLAGSLIVINGHWVADLVAGSFLGALVGSLVLRIEPWAGPPGPR